MINHLIEKSQFANRNAIIAWIIAGLFIVLKLWLLQSNPEFFVFLITPVKTFVELQSGADSIFLDGCSYYFPDLQIVIDKSCSGANFLILSFLLLFYHILMLCQNYWLRIVILPLIMGLAYLFTITVNTSRIVISILLNEVFHGTASWFHEFQGAFIYLSFFILLFLLTKFLENKIIQHYAKFA